MKDAETSCSCRQENYKAEKIDYGFFLMLPNLCFSFFCSIAEALISIFGCVLSLMVASYFCFIPTDVLENLPLIQRQR